MPTPVWLLFYVGITFERTQCGPKGGGQEPGIIKGLRGALCNSGRPCPTPFGPAELFKIDPVNFVVPFFSCKRKTLVRLLVRCYEVATYLAYETLKGSKLLLRIPKLQSSKSIGV